MKTRPKLIGLTGTNGAGKGEAAAFFMAGAMRTLRSPTSSARSSGTAAWRSRETA